MKFKYIKLKNFLSYGDNEVSFDLGGASPTLIVAKNGAGKCVSKGTKIETREFGIINIEDLEVEFLEEEEILLFKEHIHVKTDNGWHLIECLWKTPKEEMIEVELENGFKLKAAADHRVMTNRGWVKLKDLTEEDSVICDK